MEKGLVICDTNIFIHWFNNDQVTIQRLKDIGPENIALSVITVMELIAGADNNNQLKQLNKKIRHYSVLGFSQEISYFALKLFEKYHLSHKLQIPDAIIAATAIEYNLPLFTYNLKDFRYIPGLKLYGT